MLSSLDRVSRYPEDYFEDLISQINAMLISRGDVKFRSTRLKV